MIKFTLCLCILAVITGESIARVAQVIDGVNQQDLPNEAIKQARNCLSNDAIQQTTSSLYQGMQQIPGGGVLSGDSLKSISDLPDETIQQLGFGGQQRRSSQQNTYELPIEQFQQSGLESGQLQSENHGSQQSILGLSTEEFQRLVSGNQKGTGSQQSLLGSLTEPIQRFGYEIQGRSQSPLNIASTLPVEGVEQVESAIQRRSVSPQSAGNSSPTGDIERLGSRSQQVRSPQHDSADFSTGSFQRYGSEGQQTRRPQTFTDSMTEPIQQQRRPYQHQQRRSHQQQQPQIATDSFTEPIEEFESELGRRRVPPQSAANSLPTGGIQHSGSRGQQRSSPQHDSADFSSGLVQRYGSENQPARGPQQPFSGSLTEPIQQQRQPSRKATDSVSKPMQEFESKLERRSVSTSSASTSLPTEGIQQISSTSSSQSTEQTSSISSTSSESTEDISNRVELQIISLCTQVPSYYDKLISEYATADLSSAEDQQIIESIESNLKCKTNELRRYVNNYDESVSQTDPEAKKLQSLMSSAVDELIQSVDQIDDNLDAVTSQTNVQERAKAIEQHLRPAMVKFEEFCLLQTKDILKNVLKDYEASLLA